LRSQELGDGLYVLLLQGECHSEGVLGGCSFTEVIIRLLGWEDKIWYEKMNRTRNLLYFLTIYGIKHAKDTCFS